MGGLRLGNVVSYTEERDFLSNQEVLFARPAILYGSEAWCLEVSDCGIFAKDNEIHGDDDDP